MLHRSVVIVLALALLTPAALASWVSKGHVEPSTGPDARDAFMFTDAPQRASDAGKVYFNGWNAQSYSYYTSLSPNVGRLGQGDGAVSVESGIAPAIMRPFALLGVWMDCNKDGYVGLADPGLMEYSALLPGVDPALCPPRSLPSGTGQNSWAVKGAHQPSSGIIHNDGRWIHEFVPLGWDQWQTMWDASEGGYTTVPVDANPWDLNDSQTRVWSDAFLPAARSAGAYACWTTAYPRGSLHSTGGLVEAHDCGLGFRVTDTLNSQSALLDATPAGQVTFRDAPRHQRDSASLLNQENPWGDERDDAYVKTWDCSQDQVLVPDPTTPGDGSDTLANVSAPRVPPSVDASRPPSLAGGKYEDHGASLAGTANETEEGVYVSRVTNPGDCDRSNNRANSTTATAPYSLEADITNTDRVIRPGAVMTYSIGFRQSGPTTTALGPGAPRDLGVQLTGWESCLTSQYAFASGAATCWEGLWVGDQQSNWASGSFVDRDSLTFAKPRHATFYAYVGAKVASDFSLKFPGTTGAYASEGCALPPEERMYECDASRWYPGDLMPRSRTLGQDPNAPADRCTRSTAGPSDGCRPIGVFPGHPYQLRDIDCYDHSIAPLRPEGIHYGAASGQVCP